MQIVGQVSAAAAGHKQTPSESEADEFWEIKGQPQDAVHMYLYIYMYLCIKTQICSINAFQWTNAFGEYPRQKICIYIYI